MPPNASPLAVAFDSSVIVASSEASSTASTATPWPAENLAGSAGSIAAVKSIEVDAALLILFSAPQ
jgi:hypothetical protein